MSAQAGAPGQGGTGAATGGFAGGGGLLGGMVAQGPAETFNVVRGDRLEGRVALVTGGSNGIGAGVARRLAERGAGIVLADIDDDAGKALADELDATFVHCDVSRLEDNEAAVATAVERYGRLDLAFLNAGIASGCGLGEDFDLRRYRLAMGVNLDGVVFGVHAAIPALLATGGGTIVATASMAGIVGIPSDPIYAANKHAVVGLVRSLGEDLQARGIRVQGLCPSFADTAILGEGKELLEQIGFPILDVRTVVDAFFRLLDSDGTGECWFVIPGREIEPFAFRRAPGPRG
ncbi:NAD(P)-dependent dehydrogenase (short-subunit alcohol dehydrogenase family) [Streptosporangium becharense]|uniref:NAD(P)-dependent dehydrogenase (Short-subunit alcohol dehydrogenase family) n=1 Tax=Streptosporangium becharense TaxID=1816182 RepID=A0A7W9IHG6_9ACTN|nr:SDR family NAD(P)-dependent oxidoreductase [Streptosporangium becharense]MBB2912504.1 NAD(P)-dependent dehydrogenase (short-subunit alcohol dehydrogenase family) [Streptosporangium becharense]MBB5820666.1 NAD(P)-dependent dehydrogenase (short-subunit alcohol dehydrogenase family) [Streptosporangium becharense]